MSVKAEGRQHEQTFNNALGRVLREQRAAWRNDDNTVLSERHDLVRRDSGKGKNLRLDVLVNPEEMLPVAVETEFAPGDAENDAISRLGLRTSRGDKEILSALAVRVPEEVKSWDNDETFRRLEEGYAGLEYACYSHSRKERPARWPKQQGAAGKDKGFLKGGVAAIADTVEAISTPPGHADKLAEEAAEVLRDVARSLLRQSKQEVIHDLLAQLSQRDEEHGFSVAACIWLNAMLLHDRISTGRNGIDSIRRLFEAGSRTLDPSELAAQWKNILAINYHSIYDPALKALQSDIPAGVLEEGLGRLALLAGKIRKAQLGPLVDIGGELFPRLSADRKTAAAFYTKPEAAELLARLCLPDDMLLPEGGSWSDPAAVGAIRVMDPACGTGTLLRAAYRRIRVLHERAGGDAAELHKVFMEGGLCGIDISPIAAHLTAAGLSKMEVGQVYSGTNIGVASVAGDLTGSLELLDSDSLSDLFGRQVQSSRGKGQKQSAHVISVPDGSLDLVIMNPPYSRTRGGQSAFDVAGLSEAERKASQKRVGRLLRKTNANRTAGLASAFIALADQKLKPGGVLGTVLPLTAAMQGAWKDIRRLFETYYTDVAVVTTASDQRSTFSADTGMGELLLVGTKASVRSSGRVARLTANLIRPPLHPADAAELGRAINTARFCLRISKQTEGILRFGQNDVGHWVRKQADGTGNPWAGAGVRQRGLSIVTDRLKRGLLQELDGADPQRLSLPMTTFGELFEVGPTHHIIGHLVGNESIGAFEFHDASGTLPCNPALWAARAKEQQKLVVRPTHEGVAAGSEEKAGKMRTMRSTLFYARGLQWTSQALAAATTSKLVMGGRAWLALLHAEEGVRQAFALWANSTLGFLLYWAHGGRQQAGRSMMQVTAIREMPTPDFGSTGPAVKKARKIAAAEFGRLSRLSFLPACRAWCDPARIDLDAVVARMLGFGPPQKEIVDELRETWCREPSVHGNNKKALALLSQE